MSRFANNKFYQDGAAYHPLNINGAPGVLDKQNRNGGPVTLIHIDRNKTLFDETHLNRVTISPETLDSKLVEHYVARDGSYTHYKTGTIPSLLKINSNSIDPLGFKNQPQPAVVIKTTMYVQDTFSSKTAVAAAAAEAGPSQIWIG